MLLGTVDRTGLATGYNYIHWHLSSMELNSLSKRICTSRYHWSFPPRKYPVTAPLTDEKHSDAFSTHVTITLKQTFDGLFVQLYFNSTSWNTIQIIGSDSKAQLKAAILWSEWMKTASYVTMGKRTTFRKCTVDNRFCVKTVLIPSFTGHIKYNSLSGWQITFWHVVQTRCS